MPLVSISVDSSSADHSGETVLEMNLLSMDSGRPLLESRGSSRDTEPGEGRRARSPGWRHNLGLRSPFTSAEEEVEVAQRRSSHSCPEPARGPSRRREQWARARRAHTIAAKSRFLSAEDGLPVHPLLRSPSSRRSSTTPSPRTPR